MLIAALTIALASCWLFGKNADKNIVGKWNIDSVTDKRTTHDTAGMAWLDPFSTDSVFLHKKIEFSKDSTFQLKDEKDSVLVKGMYSVDLAHKNLLIVSGNDSIPLQMSFDKASSLTIFVMPDSVSYLLKRE